MHRYAVLTYVDKADRDSQLDKLKKDRDTLSAEPNLEFRPSANPNDPLLGGPTDAANTLKQWGMWRMNFPATWESRTKGNAYIAAIEFGLSRSVNSAYEPHPDHPRASPGVRSNWREHFSGSFIGTDLPSAANGYQWGLGTVVEEKPNPNGYYGHGTHVAGILAAVTDNATGVSGGCQTCSLIIINDVGAKLGFLSSDWANAMAYAVDSGAQVINLSREVTFVRDNASLCSESTTSDTPEYRLICNTLRWHVIAV